ncbi:protein kinase [Mariprofundus ferrooxydans]|nr:protein kinase [Mariprofundus ferrooxydans]
MLTLLFATAFQLQFTATSSLENMLYDKQISQATQPIDHRIIILNMDQASLRQSGLSLQLATAFAINTLTEAKAQLIGIHSIFNKAEPANNALLTRAIRHSGNTLLAMRFNVDDDSSPSAAIVPNYLKAITLKHVHPATVSNPAITASLANIAYKSLTLSAAGSGHINSIKDSDGIVRSETMAIAYGGYYFPALTLILAAQSLNISLDDIRINAGEYIELGALNIDIDAQMRIHPMFSQPTDQANQTNQMNQTDPASFPTYTFNQLFEGQLANTLFTDKIVLMGDVSHRPDRVLSTPGNTTLSRVEYSAHVLQSILHQQLIQRPVWTRAIELTLLLIIGIYLIFVLPRLSSRSAIIVSSLLFITLISSDFILLHYYALWLQTINAGLLLLIGHALFISRNTFFMTASDKPKSNVHETNKMLGISFQNQGMLDQAFEKFTTCPVDDDMLKVFDSLAQAFERKKQFQHAAKVYEYIASHDPFYKDIQTRIIMAKSSEQASIHDDANASLSNQLISGEHSPTLGRYEIISELGKGAMGTVYLGKDPKINRQVAIKTMALSQEFKPEELEEVKTKFFHEAEIAGMLNHPNIVTIFDAGDEQDLAYIAMEFLDGIDLSPYTKKDKLLPLSTTLKIVGKVAEALQYAHDHGVIHRDIKPANIMILKNKSVKVTDFGIAHIIESSKTKAGVVLGTPSYMSPEQLSGKKLDGRSDLFSLGVMLYELACGTRPFRAESIAKLMYKIAKQPHADVREHKPAINDTTCLLINDLLAKKADQRIKTASDVQARVALCLQDLNNSGESQ